jgi:hypothetical protein
MSRFGSSLMHPATSSTSHQRGDKLPVIAKEAGRFVPVGDHLGSRWTQEPRLLERSQRHPERASFGQASRVRLRRTNQTKIAAVAAATRETDANGRSASRESL